MKLQITMVSFIDRDEEMERHLEAEYALAEDALSANLSYLQMLDEASGYAVRENLLAELEPSGQLKRLTLSRPESGFTLVLDKDAEFEGEYPTEHGSIALRAKTLELSGRCKDNKLHMSATYEMYLGGEMTGVTHLSLIGRPLQKGPAKPATGA